MNDDIKIRQLELSDYKKKYIDLLNQLKPMSGCTYECFENILNSINKNPHHFVFVIERDGIIVGTITLLIEPKLLYKGKSLGHIEDFVIHKEYRKKRYGKQLIEFCKKYGQSRGCHKVGLCSRIESEYFYEKNDFIPIGKYYATYFL